MLLWKKKQGRKKDLQYLQVHQVPKLRGNRSRKQVALYGPEIQSFMITTGLNQMEPHNNLT
jgi:hypothetical protein